MRLLLPVLALPLLVPAASTAQTPAPSPIVQPGTTVALATALANANCRKVTSYSAEAGSAYRGGPMTPRNLTELPDANRYKAVYRTVNGCEEPMTVAEYEGMISR